MSAAPASHAAPTAGAAAAPPAPETSEIAPSEDECSDKVSVVLYDRPQHSERRTATQASVSPRRQGAPSVGQPGDAHAILTLSLDQPRACQIYRALEAMSAAAYAAAPADDVGASPPAGFIRTAFDGLGGGDRLPLKAGAQTSEGSSTLAPMLFDGAVRVAGGFAPPEPLPHPRTGSGDAAHPTMSLAATGAPDPFSRLLPGVQATGAQPAPADPTDAASPEGPPATGDPAGVPEPATWLLMILGLFGLGAALRRRLRAAFQATGALPPL